MTSQETTKTIDEEQYRMLFQQCKEKFPDTDDYLINVAILNHLYNPDMSLAEMNELGKDIKLREYADYQDSYEGITSQ